MASLADRVKNVVSGGSNRDTYTPIQMEEVAESRISLSTSHVLGRYSDNAEPNTDLDAEANVGLLTRDSDAVMEAKKKRRLSGKRQETNAVVSIGRVLGK